MTLRVLTLSTLFPDESRPNFGIFVERQTRELAARPGMSVTVIAPVGLPPWPLSRLPRYSTLSRLPRHEERNGLDIYRPRFPIIPLVGGRFNAHALYSAISPLACKLHRAQPFDVIDASFFYPDGPAAMMLAAKMRIPFSVKARGADIHLWASRTDTGPQIMEAARGAGGLLAVSEAMKRDMTALGMNAAKIRVHYTGVDLDRFAPGDREAARKALGLPEGPIILCVGTLSPRKGQDLLIRALPALPDATLLLAGNGPHETSLRALAREQGVLERVRFLGSVPHADIPLLMQAANVSALPSVSEGLANAWVESLACGTPLILSDVGGARELVDRPGAGLIVARDPAAIVEAVRQILDNPPAAEDVRASALRFTWQANGDALVDHLQGIVKRTRERAPRA